MSSSNELCRSLRKRCGHDSHSVDGCLNCEAADQIEEHDQSFDLRWKADMRAIKRWQEAHPGNDLTWPDHADLCVWLLEQLDARVTPEPPAELAKWLRHEASFWRDDAFENAAKICERYEAHDAARDIRHMKGSAQPPPTELTRTDALRILGGFAMWSSPDEPQADLRAAARVVLHDRLTLIRQLEEMRVSAATTAFEIAANEPPKLPWKTFQEAVPEQGKPVWWSQNGVLARSIGEVMTKEISHVWQEMTDNCCNPQCRANRNSQSANEPCPCPWSWPTPDSRTSNSLLADALALLKREQSADVIAMAQIEPVLGMKFTESDESVKTFRAREKLIARMESAAHEPDPVPPKDPSPEWILKARAEGRAEFLAILLEESAEDFDHEYMGSHSIGCTGDYGTHWEERKLRETFAVDDATYSYIDRINGNWWSQQHEIETLQEQLQRAAQPPSAKRFIPGQCNCEYESTQPDPRACPMHGTSQLSKSASPVGDFLRAMNDDAEAFADMRAAEGAASSPPPVDDTGMLIDLLEQCRAFLYDDSGTPIAPMELRERVRVALTRHALTKGENHG